MFGFYQEHIPHIRIRTGLMCARGWGKGSQNWQNPNVLGFLRTLGLT